MMRRLLFRDLGVMTRSAAASSGDLCLCFAHHRAVVMRYDRRVYIAEPAGRVLARLMAADKPVQRSALAADERDDLTGYPTAYEIVDSRIRAIRHQCLELGLDVRNHYKVGWWLVVLPLARAA